MLFLALCSAARADDRDVVFALVDQMSAAESQLQDSTYELHREEFVDGRLSPKQVMAIKYRRPHQVYLRWVGDVYRGREVLFKVGWNDDELRVSPGPMVPTVNLDPDGSVAMHGERHGIMHVGIPFLMGNIAGDTRLMKDNPQFTDVYVDEGFSMRHGEKAHCYLATMPKDQLPELYAAKARVCMSTRTSLPVFVETWDQVDGQVRLVERYGFAALQVNVGLTDEDFDPGNPAYGF